MWIAEPSSHAWGVTLVAVPTAGRHEKSFGNCVRTSAESAGRRSPILSNSFSLLSKSFPSLASALQFSLGLEPIFFR